MLGKQRLLGLAVTRRAATVVEVEAAKGQARVVRVGEFVFATDEAARLPAVAGKALREFLQKGGFAAARCVIGLEAGRLSAREKSLPPGSAGALTEILTLAVEREFAADRKELVFDYVAPPPGAAPASVLLVAAPKREVAQLTALAQAAGLSVAAVTSSTLALASAGDGPGSAAKVMLHVFRGGTELAVSSGGQVQMMRRISAMLPEDCADASAAPEGWLGDLANELRRVVYALAAGPQAPQLVVWNETPLPDSTWDALAERLGLPVTLGRWTGELQPPDSDAAALAGQYAAAAAMALTRAQGGRLPVDFLHSRLAPPRKVTLGRKVAWGAGVAAALLIALGVLLAGLIQDEQEIAALQGQLDENAESIAEAQEVVDRETFARAWYDRKPRMLGCLRELTMAFPEDGGIWVSSLNMQDDRRGVISGKASGERQVLDVLDRLKTNPKFVDVKPLYLREAGRGTREVAFAMSFQYLGMGGP
jgi:hypothetical protein